MTAKRLIKLTLFVGLILIAHPVFSTPSLAGNSLTQALKQLQRQGLNLVFSSNVVKDTMRVETEPRGATPREVLDELLAPHTDWLFRTAGAGPSSSFQRQTQGCPGLPSSVSSARVSTAPHSTVPL